MTTNATGIVTLNKVELVEARSPLQMALRRFRRDRLGMTGLTVVLFVIFIALTADIIAPYSPRAQDTSNINADITQFHTFGTDDLGRDVLSRLIYGSRIALLVGVVTESVVLAIGVPIGIIAGFYGGWVDDILMRGTDIMYAFPALLFVIILVTAFGHSVWTVFVALGVASWPTMARLVRGQVLQIKQMDYVLGARSIGAGWGGLMVRHILPNILGPIIVLVTLEFPADIIGESTLTFLGLGVEPSTPTWGSMVNAALPSADSHRWQLLYPSIAIAILTLAFSFMGDAVRDAFDPRTKGSK